MMRASLMAGVDGPLILAYAIISRLAVGRWFPPGAPVSSTSETDISASSFHCLDMTLAVGHSFISADALRLSYRCHRFVT